MITERFAFYIICWKFYYFQCIHHKQIFKNFFTSFFLYRSYYFYKIVYWTFLKYRKDIKYLADIKSPMRERIKLRRSVIQDTDVLIEYIYPFFDESNSDFYEHGTEEAERENRNKWYCVNRCYFRPF